MSPSGRPSDRVVESPANHQVSNDPRANSGADGVTPERVPRRVGAAELRRLRDRLSERDRLVLVTLRELHYLTSRQIERLHFAGHASQAAAARASRRVLRRLHEVGLLHRLERRIGGIRAGSAAHVYGLSSIGHRALRAKARKRTREPSITHLDHVLDVAELVVRITEQTRTQPLADLRQVEGEPACWRRYAAAHGGEGWLKPDLRLTISADDLELHWFVELDRGSEHRPVLTRKLRTYVAAWKAGTEQRGQGVFPRVCWVTPDEERAERLRALIDGDEQLPAGMFVVTTLKQAAPLLTGGST